MIGAARPGHEVGASAAPAAELVNAEGVLEDMEGDHQPALRDPERAGNIARDFPWESSPTLRPLGLPVPTLCPRARFPACAQNPMRLRLRTSRSVAQPGSAPEWGSGGRRFESFHSDHFFLFYANGLEALMRSASRGWMCVGQHRGSTRTQASLLSLSA